jgi:regulator of sigma E protease
MLKAITVGLVTLLSNAIIGNADFSQVTGPVGIVEHVGQAAAFGFTSLLYFTAVISLNLAVINLLPVPALDGGRLVFVAIEAITKRPINPVWAGRLNLLGFAALMLLMVVVTYNDILKLF